jgi:hypothetical protein
MQAPVKEKQADKADKRKPRCDDLDAIGPSMRLLNAHRRRESRESPDYHAQDGQDANPAVVRVRRPLGDGQPYANEAASKTRSGAQVARLVAGWF